MTAFFQAILAAGAVGGWAALVAVTLLWRRERERATAAEARLWRVEAEHRARARSTVDAARAFDAAADRAAGRDGPP